MKNELIIIGAGGHARVIADIAKKSGYAIRGFLDDNAALADKPNIIGTLNQVEEFKSDCLFVIGIGSNDFRKSFSKSHKLEYATLVHPSSQISDDTVLGNGTVVMPNAVINSGAKIGKHCIINSSSVVEHDCFLEDYVHISPGAVLCGTVSIGEKTHIGAGAVIKNNVTVCDECIIGAGCVVNKNIIERGTYVGVPARKIK